MEDFKITAPVYQTIVWRFNACGTLYVERNRAFESFQAMVLEAAERSKKGKLFMEYIKHPLPINSNYIETLGE